MDDWNDGSRLCGIDVFASVPGPGFCQIGLLGVSIDLRCCWSALSLAISNHASHDKIRLVHDGAKGYGESITQLSAFMDGARCFGIYMARWLLEDSNPTEYRAHLGKPCGVLKPVIKLCKPSFERLYCG